MQFFSLYMNDIITMFLFPFIYFLHYIGQKSVNARIDDIHMDYQHLYEHVSAIRERLVKLREEFEAHDKNEMNKFISIKKAIEEIHATLVKHDPEHHFTHRL